MDRNCPTPDGAKERAYAELRDMHANPDLADGVVYEYCTPDEIIPRHCKIGYSNEGNYRVRVKQVIDRPGNIGKFDPDTLSVHRGMTRGEARAIEAMTHTQLSLNGRHVPGDGSAGHTSSEVFEVSRRSESRLLIQKHAEEMRSVRTPAERALMKGYLDGEADRLAARKDDATDWHSANRDAGRVTTATYDRDPIDDERMRNDTARHEVPRKRTRGVGRYVLGKIDVEGRAAEEGAKLLINGARKVAPKATAVVVAAGSTAIAAPTVTTTMAVVGVAWTTWEVADFAQDTAWPFAKETAWPWAQETFQSTKEGWIPWAQKKYQSAKGTLGESYRAAEKSWVPWAQERISHLW